LRCQQVCKFKKKRTSGKLFTDHKKGMWRIIVRWLFVWSMVQKCQQLRTMIMESIYARKLYRIRSVCLHVVYGGKRWYTGKYGRNRSPYTDCVCKGRKRPFFSPYITVFLRTRTCVFGLGSYLKIVQNNVFYQQK
jgi:hypothetical protein